MKENMQDVQGRTYRDFPRLQHGGAHLDQVSDRGWDIFWRSCVALLQGLVFGGALVWALHTWRLRSASNASLPWRVYYGTVLVLAMVCSWLLQLFIIQIFFEIYQRQKGFQVAN